MTARQRPPHDAGFLTALSIVFLARRSDLLELDARRRTYQALVEFPGLHLRELARQLKVDPNHAKYHLRYLERHGLVSSRREGGYLRFFPRAQGPIGPTDLVGAADKRILALLRQPLPLHLVLILLEEDEATLGELRLRAGVAASTLLYHVRKLEASGIVTTDRRGRDRRYRLVEPDRLMDHVLRYRPPDALVRGFLEAWEQLEFP